MNQKVKELREQQARIHTNATAKFDEIKADTPAERAAEINVEFDRMMADYDVKQGHIERLEKLDKAERSMSRPDPRRPNGEGEGRGADEGSQVGYREAFQEYLRSAGQEGLMSAEARAALAKGRTSIPTNSDGETRAQTTTTNAAGGFTVPTELQAILVRSMKAWGPMYDDDHCTTITTASGNPLPLPTIDDTAVTTSTTAQGATLPDTGAKDAVFGQKQLDAFSRNTEWLRVSVELANDSIFAMEQLLGDLLGERLGRVANIDLTTGNGTTAANGIVTAATLGRTAVSTTAITWDEIIDLEHSVDPAYRASPKARYMFNDVVLQAVRKLKDGQGNYLWQMGDVKNGVPASFNGRPYSINQNMALMTTGQRVMVFGDFSKYFLRKVGAPIIGAIQDKDFWPGFGIAGYIRFDGELADTAAVKYLALA